MIQPLNVCLYVLFFTFLTDAAPTEIICGKPTNRQGKIIGGEDAQIGVFPFMVSLQAPEEPEATLILHKCGAALLNKRWILTAAHCVFEFRSKKSLRRLKARLGLHEVDGTHPDVDSQDIGVESLVTHPQFENPHRFSNDIALLRLKQDATFTQFVWPICLPDSRMDITGMNATVAGWGRTTVLPQDQNFYIVSSEALRILQRVVVPVLSNSVCKEMFLEAKNNYPLEPNQACAGYREGGKDSCQGDSGGPLFVKQNGAFTVIGIVSTGIECGKPLLPGIYTRVSSHLPWISKEIKG